MQREVNYLLRRTDNNYNYKKRHQTSQPLRKKKNNNFSDVPVVKNTFVNDGDVKAIANKF